MSAATDHLASVSCFRNGSVSIKLSQVKRRFPAVANLRSTRRSRCRGFRAREAFITGAGNRSGRAAAILFAGQGAKVAIVETDPQAGEEPAHLAGNEAIAIRADVPDPDSVI